jgi:hypothetical protein
MSDDGRLIAVFMRFLGFGERGGRMVERSAFGRLLPDCCPDGPFVELPESVPATAFARGEPRRLEPATLVVRFGT